MPTSYPLNVYFAATRDATPEIVTVPCTFATNTVACIVYVLGRMGKEHSDVANWTLDECEISRDGEEKHKSIASHGPSAHRASRRGSHDIHSHTPLRSLSNGEYPLVGCLSWKYKTPMSYLVKPASLSASPGPLPAGSGAASLGSGPPAPHGAPPPAGSGPDDRSEISTMDILRHKQNAGIDHMSADKLHRRLDFLEREEDRVARDIRQKYADLRKEVMGRILVLGMNELGF